jgi:hypothetical protein
LLGAPAADHALIDEDVNPVVVEGDLQGDLKLLARLLAVAHQRYLLDKGQHDLATDLEG